jgi:hypothetical protein
MVKEIEFDLHIPHKLRKNQHQTKQDTIPHFGYSFIDNNKQAENTMRNQPV